VAVSSSDVMTLEMKAPITLSSELISV